LFVGLIKLISKNGLPIHLCGYPVFGSGLHPVPVSLVMGLVGWLNVVPSQAG